MIEEKFLSDKADDIQAELRRAFGVRARSLTKALRKVGRRLPSHLQKKASLIVQAQSYGGNPKLMRMIDGAEIVIAHDEIMDYLSGIDPKERRITTAVNLFGDLALKLIIIIALSVVVLRWQGYF